MKKIPLNKKTKVKKSALASRWHPWAATIVVLLTAAVGIAALHYGFAASSGNLTIHIADVEGGGVGGIKVLLTPTAGGEGACSGTPVWNGSQVTTNGSGDAVFNNCFPLPNDYVLEDMDLGAHGYSIDSTSKYKIGSHVSTFANAPAPLVVDTVYVHKTDADGDGVTYENDRCPNTPGPASNSGCPVAASPPPSSPPSSGGSSSGSTSSSSRGSSSSSASSSAAPSNPSDDLSIASADSSSSSSGSSSQQTDSSSDSGSGEFTTSSDGKSASRTTKKASSSKNVTAIAGILLVLVAGFVGAWLVRRKLLEPDDQPAVLVSSVPASGHGPVHTPSLPELVMQDMQAHRKPPHPPAEPTQ